MKTAALGRGKPKDAYDIYFTINNYRGGVRKLTDDFRPYADIKIVREMCSKLNEKFASTQHVGPVDVAAFPGATGEEAERVQQDVYQKVHYLVNGLITF